MPPLIYVRNINESEAVKVTHITLTNPLSDQVPIKYVIFGEVNDTPVIFEWQKEPIFETRGGPIKLEFMEINRKKDKLSKNCKGVFPKRGMGETPRL